MLEADQRKKEIEEELQQMYDPSVNSPRRNELKRKLQVCASVKRDLLTCQKRPTHERHTSMAEETYLYVKEDVLTR